MEAVLAGRSVYTQRVAAWLQETGTRMTVTYVTGGADLSTVLGYTDIAPVFVVVGDLERDGALLDAVVARGDDVADRVFVLCPPGQRAEVAAAIPGSMTSRVMRFERGSVHRAVRGGDDGLGVRFGAREGAPTMHFDRLVGDSEPMQRVYDRIRKVARCACNCLISGETGTGKEVVARAIHEQSGRAGGPFVALNAGSIPRDLIESVLFGHEKGAFTGAVSRRKGLFEAADGGTLFIDEIGELPLELQPVFLRALQEGEIMPVGATRPRRVDVRFIAATNRNLREDAQDGAFRADLYYRLAVVPIDLPPLRRRSGDVAALVRHIGVLVNEKYGLEIAGVTRECLEALCRHPWPGNIRQLFNTVERMMVLADDRRLQVGDLPRSLADDTGGGTAAPCIDVPAEGLDFYAETERFQRAILEQVLDQVSWNKNRAATLLRMNRTTLVERLKRLGMSPQPDAGVA